MLRLLADWAERTGHDLPDLEVRRPTLEDAYLQPATLLARVAGPLGRAIQDHITARYLRALAS